MEVFRSAESQSLAASHFHFETPALSDAVKFYTDVMNFSVICQSPERAVLAIPTGQALVLHEVGIYQRRPKPTSTAATLPSA